VVPLPAISFKDEMAPLSEIFAQAMKAEQAAHDFYLQLSELFNDDFEKKNLLLYFSMMEMGHFKLLELEKINLERLEEYGEEQEMIHVGP
jgi:rubrerythrin